MSRRPVDQDRVRARHGVEQFGHVVVRLDLDAVRLEGSGQAQRLGRFHHLAAERLPSRSRARPTDGRCSCPRRHSSWPAASRRAIFSRAAARRTTTLAISLPTVVGLAVWPCVRLSIATSAYAWAISRKVAISAVQRRQHHLLAGGLELQRVAGVVDVLAGAGEMHELAGALQLGPGLEFGLDPVLHGLHVVIRGLLDFLDREAVGFGEVLDQSRAGRCGHRE